MNSVFLQSRPQHEQRLRTGDAPDGSVGAVTAKSGKFVSDEAQIEAARLADEELINHALNAKGTKFKKNVDVTISKPGSGSRMNSTRLDICGDPNKQHQSVLQATSRPKRRTLCVGHDVPDTLTSS